MSFTSSDANQKPRSRSGSIGSNASQSFIGGFKSLYASLTKSGSTSSHKKEKENRVSAANKKWFDQGEQEGGGAAPPQRPPRKARSTASSMTSGQGGGYQSYNKRQNKSTTNLNQVRQLPLK